MSTEAEFDWDSLGEREGNFSAGLLELLADVQWAAPLLAGIRDAGGVRRDTKSLLFELRFANALQEAGVVAEYEIPGEGDSRIDFGFTSNGQRWAVELLRLAETAAVQAATRNTVDGDEVVWSSRALRTNAEDARQSEEGEMLKVVQRICQKCERGGQPHKFAVPAGQFNVLLVDMRTFLMRGGDEYDWVHIALGGEYMRNEFLRRYWEGQLITGVFSARTAMRGTAFARTRLHFIVFVREEEYASGSFGNSIFLVPNPHLFTAEQVAPAVQTWPLPGLRGFGF
jgi:hypothetical protein